MDEHWQEIPKFKELSFRLSFILIEIAVTMREGIFEKTGLTLRLLWKIVIKKYDKLYH